VFCVLNRHTETFSKQYACELGVCRPIIVDFYTYYSLILFINKFVAPASDDELSQRFRSRSETPQRPVYRTQGQGQGQGQGQTGGSEIDTSSYRHNLLGAGY